MSDYKRTDNAFHQQWNLVHGSQNEHMGARNDLAWSDNPAGNNYQAMNRNTYAHKGLIQNFLPIVNKNLMAYDQKRDNTVIVKNVVANNNKEIDLSKKGNEKAIAEKKIIDSIVEVEISDSEDDTAFDNNSQLNEAPKFNTTIETATNRAYENITQVYNDAVAHLQSGPDTLVLKSLLPHVAEMVAQKSLMEQKKSTKNICSQTDMQQCHKSTQAPPHPKPNMNQYDTNLELQYRRHQAFANQYQHNNNNGERVRGQYYDNRGVYNNPDHVMQRQVAVENVVPQRKHVEFPNAAPMLVPGAVACRGAYRPYRPYRNQLPTRKRNYYQSNYPTRAQYPQFATAQNFDIDFTNNVNTY